MTFKQQLLSLCHVLDSLASLHRTTLTPWALIPGGSGRKESACNAGDAGSIPGSGRSPEKEWQSTPLFLTAESHGQRSLVGYSPWGLHGLGQDWAANTSTFTDFLPKMTNNLKLTKSEGLTTALWLAGVRAPLPPHLLLSTVSPTAHLHVCVVLELQGPCSHDSGAYWPVAVVATWPPVEWSKFKNPAEQLSHIMLTSTIQTKPEWLGSSSLNLTQPKTRLAPLQWGSWSIYKL